MNGNTKNNNYAKRGTIIVKGNLRFNKYIYTYCLKTNDDVNNYLIGWIVNNKNKQIFKIIWKTEQYDFPMLQGHQELMELFKEALMTDINKKGGIEVLMQRSMNRTFTSAKNSLSNDAIALVRKYGDITTALNVAAKLLKENDLLNTDNSIEVTTKDSDKEIDASKDDTNSINITTDKDDSISKNIIEVTNSAKDRKNIMKDVLNSLKEHRDKCTEPDVSIDELRKYLN